MVMRSAPIAAGLLLIAALWSAPQPENVQARTVASLRGAPIAARVDYKRLLEPKDRVLHGAGQSDETSFAAYTRALAGSPPMLTMSYVDLKDDIPVYMARLQAELARYPALLVPQIGLSLNAGVAAQHYEAEVAAGKMEAPLQELCAGLQVLDRPVFVRIGYEFNGFWNGYQPAAYVAAYRHIAAVLHACAPGRIATVWDWSADADIVALDNGFTAEQAAVHRASFYPGDDAVDWWGMNLFSARSIAAPATQVFLAEAAAHHFPVMIGESTPQHRSVAEGQALVDDWFAPYFGLIRSSPQIKAFCYIDWDWRKYPQWADWGDARIEGNAAVFAFYATQMQGRLYEHAEDRKHTLKVLRVH